MEFWRSLTASSDDTHAHNTTHDNTHRYPMRIELVQDNAHLLRLESEWNGLPFPTPMQSPVWLTEWCAVYGSHKADCELCTLAFYNDDDLVGVAPLYIRNSRLLGATLRLLGDGEVCSDHAGILSTAEAEDEVRAEAFRWLKANAGKRWHQMELEAIDHGQSSIRTLVRDLKNGGLSVMERESQGSWCVDLPATWEEYLSMLSKNHRKRCRRWINDYFESGRATVDFTTDESDVVRGLDMLVDMNRQQRESSGIKSCFSSEDLARFHHRVISRLASQEQAAIRRLYVDGSLVAMEYALYDQNTVYCYQSAMIARKHRDGFGTLSVLALIRHAQSLGLKRVDFLRGNESYKRSWNATHVPAVDFVVSANSAHGRIGNMLSSSKEQLRRWKRRYVVHSG